MKNILMVLIMLSFLACIKETFCSQQARSERKSDHSERFKCPWGDFNDKRWKCARHVFSKHISKKETLMRCDTCNRYKEKIWDKLEKEERDHLCAHFHDDGTYREILPTHENIFKAPASTIIPMDIDEECSDSTSQKDQEDVLMKTEHDAKINKETNSLVGICCALQRKKITADATDQNFARMWLAQFNKR